MWLKSWINAGVPADARATDVKHIQATNIVALAGAAAISTWIPAGIHAGQLGNAAQNLLCAVAFLAAVAVNRAGRPTAATVMAMLIANAQLVWAIYWFGYASNSAAFYAALVVGSYLCFPRSKRRLAHASALLSTALWAGAAAAQDQFPLRMEMMPVATQSAVNAVLTSGILVAVAAGFLAVVELALGSMERERKRADDLLLNVLPPTVAARLKADPGDQVAQRHESVSVLFADIVGFTPLSVRLSPGETVELLNAVFSAFDAICTKHRVDKIKTIGDGYMVVAGAPEERDGHELALLEVAREMLASVGQVPGAADLQLRVGLHAGPAVSAIVGQTRFHWDLWGDTVNTAARMESHGIAGRIQVTSEFRQRIGDAAEFEPRGLIEVKGKGPMEPWLLVA